MSDLGIASSLQFELFYLIGAPFKLSLRGMSSESFSLLLPCGGGAGGRDAHALCTPEKKGGDAS